MRFSPPILNRRWLNYSTSVIAFSQIMSGLALLALPTVAYSQTLPEAADIGRVPTAPQRDAPNSMPADDNMVPSFSAPTEMPEGVERIHLRLNKIKIDGATAFTPDELAVIYNQYLGKDVTLDVVYKIAAQITELYKNSGYFLSIAYVPEQSIQRGTVHIKVIEGYIGDVESEDRDIAAFFPVRSYINDLLKQKPLKSDVMESFLLRINDLPGYTFRAVLAPMHGLEDGAVKLSLIPAPEVGHGSVSFDNFSSRFMGPNQVSASYEKSFIPFQKTSISTLSGLPTDKLRYLTVGHSIAFAPNVTFNINANVTRSQPGYTLEPLDVQSKSSYIGIGWEWQYIRQRTENAAFSFMLDTHNTQIDFLNTPFTRDRVRAIRLKANYDGDWGANGYNWIELTLSHGIPIFGANEKGDDNLSREQAKPTFTKAEVSVTRYQQLPYDLSLMLTAAGQLASGPLYSSEEFGYGGQSFGRAYDPSEMTGDRGVSGALELQYHGLRTGERFKVLPYAFYDIGAVWNYDVGQEKRQSGASAGVGTRIQVPYDVSFNFGLAFPLTRKIETPIYGSGESGPRLFLQLTKSF